MRPRKIRERYLFFRDEWPFQDERILINHHIDEMKEACLDVNNNEEGPIRFLARSDAKWIFDVRRGVLHSSTSPPPH